MKWWAASLKLCAKGSKHSLQLELITKARLMADRVRCSFCPHLLMTVTCTLRCRHLAPWLPDASRRTCLRVGLVWEPYVARPNSLFLPMHIFGSGLPPAEMLMGWQDICPFSNRGRIAGSKGHHMEAPGTRVWSRWLSRATYIPLLCINIETRKSCTNTPQAETM